MLQQMTLFDMEYKPYKITKPIRLIELFGGIGSQAKALENLGVNFEHYRLVEFDKYPVASYNAVHGTNFVPTDITKINGDYLGIKDKDKFDYIMTYSFPCTDLSIAGKMKGMSKESGTRSGLLWEVERLLNETKELPQILLMENVPQVIGSKNIEDFKLWLQFLEQKGYKNYYQVLNAKDYGIPQNRNRCFMISILGDYRYNFPKPQILQLRLKDILENKVDKKYFVSRKKLIYLNKKVKQGWKKQITTDINGVATCVCNPARNQINDTYIDNNLLQVGELDIKGNDCIKRVYDPIGLCPTITTMEGGNRQPKIIDDNLNVRKLTPKECWRLMGFSDLDFNNASKVNSNSQLYKQSGNSIVVNVLMAIFAQLM